ncbi:FAD dependent oxidoreductase [Thermosinus carboxydivorans Nor1]|uniref:FAD dependent oxidoreductase n=1 Tax=Thermosinus carboxydivorans Nor1 TaxID=401526 RepID=A1HRV3_9FIRM|nr:NAD(P)/FAD-dependent oxidoreductase [Thermosinus carboxydivorans]EAX47274.1 FAD dependent oxidoreductase [Thermosinus carboxydivorans Nor1]
MAERMKADVVIIGGGIVGAAIARELARFELDTVLVERHPDVAMGTSKANSGILHAGFDAQPGTLKAKLNVRGNDLYRRLQEELDLEIKWTGSLVIAHDAEGMQTIHELLDRGRANGVPGLAILDREAVLAREPKLTKDVVGALWAPTAGVICPFGAAIAMAENAVQNGVHVITECPVYKIEAEGGRIKGVHTGRGFISAKFVVNAAGVQADDLSRSAGDESFSIRARKGEYILFDKTVGKWVNSIIFPTPSKVSKGILVAPTVHGNLFIGPNAREVDDRADLSTTSQGLAEIINGARQLVPDLPLHAAITQFAGLRAAADGGDFIIRPSATVRGLVHAAGIQSPGLTAAPAIAEKVVDILREEGLNLRPKASFNPIKPRRIRFNELTRDQQRELVARNPLYGRVICRCETVTEGEIVAAIHAPCGARTVDGVKRRTRAGMGRCQGGFCGPRVVAILARELGIPVTAVRKDTARSYLFYDKIPRSCEVDCHDKTEC